VDYPGRRCADQLLGVPAGLIGNELSIRYGLRTIATLVFLLSALAGGLLGFTAMLPYITVLGLSVIAARC